MANHKNQENTGFWSWLWDAMAYKNVQGLEQNTAEADTALTAPTEVAAVSAEPQTRGFWELFKEGWHQAGNGSPNQQDQEYWYDVEECKEVELTPLYFDIFHPTYSFYHDED